MRHWLDMDVFSAARLRLEEAFDAFERVYVSFSGERIPASSSSSPWISPVKKAASHLMCYTSIWKRGMRIPMPSALGMPAHPPEEFRIADSVALVVLGSRCEGFVGPRASCSSGRHCG